MIAFVSQRFPVGTETFTYDEVEGLRRNGLDVTVFSLRPGEPLGWPVGAVRVLPSPAVCLGAVAYWLLRRPLRVVRALAWLRPSLASLAALPRGAWLARVPDVELYHAQFAFEAATAALIAAHLSRRPFSFRSHTGPRAPALRSKLRHAAIVLSISDYDRGLLLDVEPKAHVEVARLGVRIPPPPSAADPGLVVAVGSLIEKKGHAVLLSAVALLAERGVDVRCEIVGEGPERAALERLAGPRATLRGQLGREETQALLARAEVCVLASVHSAREGEDGIPVSLMEALAFGKPVVASGLSGIPELVRDGETGLLVPPGDVAALADALERLLRDPELRRRLGEAGRSLVAELYAEDARAARAAELLRSSTA